MSRLFIYLFITTQQKDLRPLTLFEHTDRIEIVWDRARWQIFHIACLHIDFYSVDIALLC